jgi:enoyl-CoA hydratase/carnithine racemase
VFFKNEPAGYKYRQLLTRDQNGMEKKIIREDKGYVSTITIDRPDKKNALDAEALFALGDTIMEIEKKDSIRVIVLRGSGKEVFSSGVDLAGGQKEFKRTIEGLEYCLDNLINYPMLVISMVYGPAIGIGLDLCVLSDFCIAAQGARFGAPLVRLGRTYYYTQIERLTRLIGIRPAKEMLLGGRLIDAQRAKEIDLVNLVVSPDKLEPVAYSLANELAEETAPIAVRITKLTIRKLFEENPLNPILEEELKLLHIDEINRSKDAEEGIKAMLEKRRPVFTGS